MSDKGQEQEKRSYIMSRVRSKGSRIERLVAAALDSLGEPYKEHVTNLQGKPDFVLPDLYMAVFVDSCFWHGCEHHCRMPKSDVDYWIWKINYNRRRDERQRRALRQQGWVVMRIWEHDLKREAAVGRRLASAIKRARGRTRSPNSGEY